jgi:hypothetical protein
MLAKEWDAVAENILDWARARNKQVAIYRWLRQHHVHAHGVVFTYMRWAWQALHCCNNTQELADTTQITTKIDWSRANVADWEGERCCMVVSTKPLNVHPLLTSPSLAVGAEAL